MMPAPKMRTKYILLFRQHGVGKVPHRYTVQEGDATMNHIGSRPGQKILIRFLIRCAVKLLSVICLTF